MVGQDADNLEARMRAVENSVTAIQTEGEHLATIEDLNNMENRLVRWQIGIWAVAIVSLATVAMRVIS